MPSVTDKKEIGPINELLKPDRIIMLSLEAPNYVSLSIRIRRFDDENKNWEWIETKSYPGGKMKVGGSIDFIFGVKSEAEGEPKSAAVLSVVEADWEVAYVNGPNFVIGGDHFPISRKVLQLPRFYNADISPESKIAGSVERTNAGLTLNLGSLSASYKSKLALDAIEKLRLALLIKKPNQGFFECSDWPGASVDESEVKLIPIS